jgi:AcrR family transcriptional regulator
MTATINEDRKLRADAQRNYDAIVSAAVEAFTSFGTQASLDDIAAKAGVGNATLYRRFPTRDSLLVAALKDRLAELARISAQLEASEDAGAALSEWFLRLATHLRSWLGLPDSVAEALRNDDSPLNKACQPLRETTDVLLQKAKSASAVRSDLSGDDVFTIIASLAWAAGKRDDSDKDLRRMIDIAYRGMS